MSLDKNRKAVVAILNKVEPRILGQPHAGFSCNCGAVNAGPGVAVSVEPGGDTYPGQEVLWCTWSVHISHHPEDTSAIDGFSVGLSEFIPANELDQIFARYFGHKPNSSNPYGLGIKDDDRAKLGYPTAVKIQDNSHQIRFCFDWGKEQKVAAKINNVASSSQERRMAKGSGEFTAIVNIMQSIIPEVYRGGPDPVLPFESAWHLDYQAALAKAMADANHIFLQNNSSFYCAKSHFLTGTDIVFMKLEVH